MAGFLIEKDNRKTVIEKLIQVTYKELEAQSLTALSIRLSQQCSLRADTKQERQPFKTTNILSTKYMFKY